MARRTRILPRRGAGRVETGAAARETTDEGGALLEEHGRESRPRFEFRGGGMGAEQDHCFAVGRR